MVTFCVFINVLQKKVLKITNQLVYKLKFCADLGNRFFSKQQIWWFVYTDLVFSTLGSIDFFFYKIVLFQFDPIDSSIKAIRLQQSEVTVSFVI